jgi:hypothetical protein
MTRNFRLALIGCCALAGVGLLAEFALPFFTSSSESLESARARDERAAAKKLDGMVAEILKRPVFSAGRAPPAPMVAAKPEPPRLQGRLAGVVLQPDFKEALFARPGGKPLAVKEGDVIDGWTVGKIEEDQVTLTSAFGEQVVRPSKGGPDELTTPAPRPMVKKATPTKGAPPRQGPALIPGRPPAPPKKADLQSTNRLAQASPEAGSWQS